MAPQDPRAVHGSRPRHQDDQGRGARALPERRLSRQSRIVCDSRRRGGGTAVFRQGRQQPVARRGRHDCRHHSIAEHALSVQFRCQGAGSAQRRTESDGQRRLHRARCGRPRLEGTALAGGARARCRGALLCRLRRPDDGRAISCRHGNDAGGRCLYDIGPSPAALRARCGERRHCQGRSAAFAPPASTCAASRADRGGSSHRRHPRHGGGPLLQPVTVQSGRQREPAAGIGLQAVRVPRRIRTRGRRGHLSIARDARQRRADDIRRKWDAMDPGELSRTSTTARSRFAGRSPCRATRRP